MNDPENNLAGIGIAAPEPKPRVYPSSDLIDTILENQSPVILEVGIGDGPKGAAIFYPEGMHYKSAKDVIKDFQKVPERRIGTHTANRVESLIDLTNRFADQETSVIFAEAKVTDNSIAASITSILDFHPKNEKNEDARNAQHKIFYNFPISSVFQKWLKTNCVVMSQADFAVFLEDHIGEIVSANSVEIERVQNLSPVFADPLDMLGLCRDLKIYAEEKLEESFRPSSGERKLKFSVVHKDASGNVLSIPDFFVINVPMFEAGADQRIMVKLRYRKQPTGAVFSYDLYRVDKMLEEAFNVAVEDVKRETQLPVFIGKAAS